MNGGLAPEVIRHVQPAVAGEIAAHAGAADLAKERVWPGTGTPGAGGPPSVERGSHVRPGEGDDRGGVEAEGGALHGDLQPGGGRPVAASRFASLKDRSHRTRWRHAHGPAGTRPGKSCTVVWSPASTSIVLAS